MKTRATSAARSTSLSALSELGGLVYSTESGRTCPNCRQAMADCRCRALAAAAKVASGDGVVRVSREIKGRAGKGVTLVRGVPLMEAELVALGKQLKAACGSGGTVKDGVIEVQGDHVERVMQLLQAQGHKVKRAGG
jgi:translation initiation factor 1